MTSLSSVILSGAKNLYSYPASAYNSQTDPLPESEEVPFQGDTLLGNRHDTTLYRQPLAWPAKWGDRLMF